MFAISVELLSGRYVACAYNDRDRVEWPPHPARLFSALVAAWADGERTGVEGDSEREALEWLERQSPPVVLASGVEAAGIRDVVTVFVPVNDSSVVSAPDREKLDQVEAAFAITTDPKGAVRTEKEVEKLRRKLVADTAKATAVPAKFAKEDPVKADRVVSDRRTRQPRTFPSATPECATVGFQWEGADPPEPVRAALARLLARLVRLGHSSSFVHARVLAPDDVSQLATRTCRFRPDDDDGELTLRAVGAGQLKQLLQAYDLHRETEPRVLPARSVRYTVSEERLSASTPQSEFGGDFVVFARSAGPRLPVTSVVGVARQFRRALMSCADDPIHEVVSGHKVDGGPTERTHLAVVPLPRVVGPHADGGILGIALVLPFAIDAAARRAVMRAVGKLEQAAIPDQREDNPAVTLKLGDAGDLDLRRVVWGEDRRVTLRSRTWCRTSRRWASATPVALDRNPGDLHDADAKKRRAAFQEASRIIAESVGRIGLPAPVEIDAVRSCVVAGTAKPRAYPRFPPDPKRPQRVLVHARLVFAEPVKGPILIGAGRYHGLGLFLPVDGGADD